MNALATTLPMLFLGGVALIVSWVSSSRRHMWKQIAPFVLEAPKSRQMLEVSPWMTNSILIKFTRALERPWGSDVDCQMWLQQTGKSKSLIQFRIQQMASTLGLTSIAVFFWLLNVNPSASQLLPTFIVISLSVVTAGWISKIRLTTLVQKRTTAIEAQLPHTLEILAFTMSAGEPLLGAMHRVAMATQGVLAEQLLVTLRSITLGRSIAEGLTELGKSSSSTSLDRAVQALRVALERGTPLAEVLRAQAGDARAHHKRLMLELAARKETTMMIPVVFLILPLIVAVAIYPGLIALNVI